MYVKQQEVKSKKKPFLFLESDSEKETWAVSVGSWGGINQTQIKLVLK